MTDEAGEDAKLLAVPHEKLTQAYNDVQDITDLPEMLRNQIKEFFENYKNLEKGKWVKVESWEGVASAKAKIQVAAAAYKG
jgi:inorganic pyrophosphatase